LLDKEFARMPRNTSIVLSDELREFVEREVRSGRYSSASEVLRDGLRLLEDRALTRDRLKAAIVEGEDSGPAEAFDMDSFLDDQNAAWGKRA
jgi:antitoxin ParD1/3/4